MKLVDTSAWIHALRPNGDPQIRARVNVLLQSGDAAWCALVRLELWTGARGPHEKRVLREMERDLPDLEINGATWDAACELARLARESGHTIPATDLLIAACAQLHGVEIEHEDEHFNVIAKLR
ncbi:MAG: PIN domain-containing protein [Acidobacteriota bacterium]